MKRAFTLIELLVVMGVIVILIALTVMAVGGMSRSMQQSSATNTVKALVGQARAMAVKSNKRTGVVFRAVIDGEQTAVEGMIVSDTGERSYQVISAGREILSQRYMPVNGLSPARLPAGMKIAYPAYGAQIDDLWFTQTELTTPSEYPGRVCGFFFNSDGSSFTPDGIPGSNVGDPRWVAETIYVDWNADGAQNVTGTQFFEQVNASDEPNVNGLQLAAVFDEDEAREYFGDADWSDRDIRSADLKAYIDEYADRVAVNRYTGMLTKP